MGIKLWLQLQVESTRAGEEGARDVSWCILSHKYVFFLVIFILLLYTNNIILIALHKLHTQLPCHHCTTDVPMTTATTTIAPKYDGLNRWCQPQSQCQPPSWGEFLFYFINNRCCYLFYLLATLLSYEWCTHHRYWWDISVYFIN